MADFELTTVVHLVRPTGARARDLDALREGIAAASDEVIFYHAFQYVLRFHDADELPHDDFSAWVSGVVQDRETAERLAFAGLSARQTVAEARAAFVAVLDSVPERDRRERASHEAGEFRFHAADSVKVPTGKHLHSVQELVDHLLVAEPACIFYHVIQRPLLEPNATETLEGWVEAQGQPRFAEYLREASHWGLPLEDVRQRLVRRWSRGQLKRRLAERTQEPEAMRKREGQRAVAKLVHRIRRPGGKASS